MAAQHDPTREPALDDGREARLRTANEGEATPDLPGSLRQDVPTCFPAQIPARESRRAPGLLRLPHVRRLRTAPVAWDPETGRRSEGSAGIPPQGARRKQLLKFSRRRPSGQRMSQPAHFSWPPATAMHHWCIGAFPGGALMSSSSRLLSPRKFRPRDVVRATTAAPQYSESLVGKRAKQTQYFGPRIARDPLHFGIRKPAPFSQNGLNSESHRLGIEWNVSIGLSSPPKEIRVLTGKPVTRAPSATVGYEITASSEA